MRFVSSALVLGLLAATLVPKLALAATSSASFGITVTVLSSCEASAPTAAFGNSPTTASSPVSVSCTNPTPYNVSMSADLAASSARNLTAPAKGLPSYRLSLGSAHSNGGSRGAAISTLARGSNDLFSPRSPYYRSAWTQEVASGVFADSVTVTIIY